MTVNRFARIASLALAIGAVSSLAATAQTINWGNASPVPFGTDINFTSTGSVLDASYTFELGVFNGGFDPTVENPEDWFLASNWTTLDTATYTGATSLFSDSYVLPDDTYKDRQAYIFGYNHKTPVDETTEWVLITNDSSDGDSLDNWTIPAHDDQGALTLEWRVSNASVPIFGGLNDDDGPGEQSNDPPAFELQTNTFLPVVPEPGSFALIGLATLLGFRRRRA